MLTNSAYGSARIKRIRTDRIQTELDARKIVLVAGFQGINKYDDITTLGRGGSDTSAVALAASLHADLCQIYTDVDGVYTADPRSVTGRESWKRSPTTRCWNWPAWGRPGAAQPLGGNGQAIQRQSGGSLQLHRESGYES